MSEWADNSRYLTGEESPSPGLWKTSTTPYLKAIMDTFSDRTTQVATFLKPTQVGATETAINICGYTIDYSPARIFYVLPDEDTAKEFSVDRLQKSLAHTPSIAKKLKNAQKSKALVIRYPGGFIRLSGANSPAKLASWPIPRVIMDEVDKFPMWTGREANPVSLVKERTKNWPWRKIIVMSTPTTEYGYVYKSYEESEVHYGFKVPCPKCGHFQELDFHNLKFPTDADERTLAKETYYECEKCHAHWSDKDKLEALKGGMWVPDENLGYKPKTVGFRLNTLYSPWVRFGEMAQEFLKSKDDPTKLMNFVNSWLGLPWKSKASMVKSKQVLEKRTDLPSGICPKDTIMLTGGVDCQQGYFYWVIRAWQPGLRSQKIANGTAMTFDDLMNIMNKMWPVYSGNKEQPIGDKQMQVVLCAVDSGYNTEEIYDYCCTYYPITIPVKGMSTSLTGYFRRKSMATKEFGNKYTQGQNLYEVDTNKYKDLIAYRIGRGVDEPCSWNVDADTDAQYAEMITAEQKILVDGKEVWRPISSARPNHYLDCEVYAACAADVMNIRAYSMKGGTE